ncbi:hypothetical protein [Dyella sp. 20L07]|uniref:ApeI family dehydratase n=1 Tax=Dyella sp. 20L07 TaxID=3384240 RepID=UPI003D2A2752
MNINAQSVTNALLDHPWVACVATGDTGDAQQGVALQPTPVGVDTLRQQGRRAFVQELNNHLAARGMANPAQWRLCDEWPTDTSADWASTLLRQSRPTQPILLAEQTGDSSALLTLRLPLDLAHFEVHFPPLPVLPGVVQVAWALAQAADRLGTPRTCRRVEMLKFQRPLRPGDSVTLSLRYDPNLLRLQFGYAHGDTEYSSGRLSWKHDNV